MTSYRIEPLPEGGFVIFDSSHEMGTRSTPLFATASLDEALNFIHNKIHPGSKSKVAAPPGINPDNYRLDGVTWMKS